MAKEHVASAMAEIKQRREDHNRNRPVAMFKLSADEEAARLIFEGLMLHYVECITGARMDAWARAGHAAIELLAAPNTKVHSRAVMSYDNALAQLEIMLRDVKLNPRIQRARETGANV